MKAILLTAALLIAGLAAGAQNNTATIIAQSATETTGGVGGYTDVAYTFSKGDKITIRATASKLLDRMMVFGSDHSLLGRVKGTKKVDYSFTMPKDDSVTFHFIADRGGSTKIDYTITKE